MRIVSELFVMDNPAEELIMSFLALLEPDFTIPVDKNTNSKKARFAGV